MDRKLQQRLRLALDAAGMTIWDSVIAGDRVIDSVVNWQSPGPALLGLPPAALRQPFPDFLQLVHPDDRDRVLDTMQDGVDQRGEYEVEYRVRWADGETRWLAAKARISGGAKNHASAPGTLDTFGTLGTLGTLGMVWDITGRKRDEQRTARERELAQVTLRSIGEGVITTDEHGKILYLNRAAEQLTGWSCALARGAAFADILRMVDDHGVPVPESVAVTCLRTRQAIGASSHNNLATRDGRLIAVEESAAPIWADDGAMQGVVVVLRDVSHERKLTRQLAWNATHDALTGLINRREFENRVADALHGAKDQGQLHALLYLDLDQFKLVNDTCGHGAGDLLLQLLTKMLQTRLRDSDVLARLGGDELGVLLPHCPPDRAMLIADQLRQSVKDFRFVWDGRTFELGVSIGVAEINHDSKSMTELLVAADQACYQAKERGRNRVHLYQESDQQLAQRHGEMLWVTRLNQAFERHSFRLYAQPIVSLDERAERHDEVLIRIHNGNDELILPGAFIPAAERYDMMTAIDRWVIQAVCRHIQSERDSLPPELAFADSRRPAPAQYSVNLSGTSMADDGLHDYIIEQFVRHEIAPEQICFEITETAVVANLHKAQLFMAGLKQLGCRFSLDDFGSGLSSFAYLKALPVDYLKIDGIFVRDIATNPVNRAMVKAINEVGHVMGLRTVAEYVEDQPTLETVRELGVDFAQGYAVGVLRPLTPGTS